MADQERLTAVTLPFSRGVDTSTQLEALDAQAGFTQLVNTRWSRSGALTKRRGFEDVAQSSLAQVAAHLFDWRGSAAMLERSTAFAPYRVRWRTTDPSNVFPRTEMTRVSEVTASRYAVSSIRDTGAVALGTPLGSVDSCQFGTVQIAAVTESACEVIVSDGELTLGRAVVANVGLVARLVPTGAITASREACLVYLRTLDGFPSFRVLTWVAGALVVGAEQIIITSAGAPQPSQWWDACESGPNVLFAYVSAAGVYTAREFTTANITVDTWGEAIASVAAIGVGVHRAGTSRTRYVVTGAGSTYSLRQRTPANAMSSVSILTTALGAIAIGMVTVDLPEVHVLIKSAAGCFAVRVTGMAALDVRYLYGCFPTSRPLKTRDTVYCTMDAAFGASRERYCILTDLFSTELILSAVPWAVRPVASVAPRLVAAGQERLGGLFLDADGSAMRTGLGVGVSSLSASLQYARFSFTKTQSSAPAASCMYFAGGLVERFDGAAVLEAAFLHRPSLVTATAGAAGNVTTSTGSVQYILAFEHVDNQGNLEQSAPSLPRVFLAGTIVNQQVTVVCRPLNLTQRFASGTPPKVVLYRTIQGGSLFYRVQALTLATTAQTIVFVDNLLDTDIQSRPLFYKGLGIPGDFVDRVHPPGLSPIVIHQDRVVGVGGDGVTLWFSNQAVQGEGVYWSEAFTQVVQQDGRATALASQDGVLYVFKRNSVFAVSGEGPSENGSGGYAVQRIACDVGCVNPASVIVTPDGVWFQSTRGLELLSRGGNLAPFIGDPVSGLFDPGVDVITSAVSDAAKSIILWTVRAGTGAGFTLVYDQKVRAWSLDRVGCAGVAESVAVAASLIGDVYTRLHVDGRVLTERSDRVDPTATNSGWIEVLVETSWVRMAGLVGEQDVESIYLLGRGEGPHGLQIRVVYDYRVLNSATPSTRTYTSAEVASLLTTGREAYRVQLRTGSDKRGTAVRVNVRDVPPAGWVGGAGGQSAAFVGLVFEGSTRGSHARHATKER